MRSLALALALCAASPLFCKATTLPTDQTQRDKPATIKVLLHEKSPSLLVEVKGGYRLFCPYTNVLITSGSFAKRDRLTPGEDGVRWGELLPGTYGFRIVPSDNQTTIFVNGIQYKGCMEVYDIGGSLRVINEVDIENYLRSCLATQLFDVKEDEVLNTLAILARTEAYHNVQTHSPAPWHVVAKEVQYTGFATTFQHPSLERAITKTRHAVLTRQDKLLATSWTKTSSKKEENLRNTWSFQMAKQELANLAHLASVAQVALCRDKESGKIQALTLAGEKEEKATIDFCTLQQSLGKTKLKSNDFTVDVLGEIVRFEGQDTNPQGEFCLQTATLMARRGLDAKRILSHFFGETHLERMRSLPKQK